MEVETVLVPVDGTAAATNAVRYAAAVAERYDARVHALYLLDALENETRNEQVMVATGMAVGDLPLTHSSAYGFDTSSLLRHPGSVVLDATEDAGADFVVVPREEPSDVLGKVAEYVIQYANQPVLSV